VIDIIYNNEKEGRRKMSL